MTIRAGRPRPDGDLLFLASFRELTTWVGHARCDEISALAPSPKHEELRGHLDHWALIAIRFVGRPETQLHALGSVRETGCVWITSRIMSSGENQSSIITWSGNRYNLGSRGAPELAPELRAHLRYALLTWGFVDVTE